MGEADALSKRRGDMSARAWRVCATFTLELTHNLLLLPCFISPFLLVAPLPFNCVLGTIVRRKERKSNFEF